MTDEEKKKIEDEAREKAKAEAEALERARESEEKNRKSKRRIPREDDDAVDIGAELAALEKKLDSKIEEIAKHTGINKYLIYVPVGILFFAALGSVAGAVVNKMKERRNG